MSDSTPNGLLNGKVVIVTGAGRGIGRGIALAMAAEGAKIVVNDLGVSLTGDSSGETPAESVVAEIKAMGGDAVADTHSVADFDAAQAMVETAISTFGRIDSVVNNAGNLRDVIFHRMSEEEFDAVIAVHLKGSFNTSRAAAPHLKAQGSGSLIHMTSTSGLIGNFGQVNYCAAKLGIVGMSKAIALDMQKFGVRSNAVAPFAWTRMVSSIPDETPEQKKRVEGLKKLIPEKIAPFVAALASDGAKHVSGQIFGVRNNEIYLFSQPRPIRTAHTAEGWTPQSVVDRVFPQFENDFYALQRSGDVFTWDPV
ncbi:SDR family NAD(P)-dependent oxidoreductase [Polycyclovorans algicola]|uniref:SDR family NAD(P)-dependent oxidoreductase n=1 Tax=Polycyclovorans algicola TaxID=616992 RepID=UPI0004A755CE|nr:SDR family NAD(P)-dependent oxidoreductase [Polycyclovorans algicola]